MNVAVKIYLDDRPVRVQIEKLDCQVTVNIVGVISDNELYPSQIRVEVFEIKDDK